jgi:ERCC4-type nuclease
VVPEPVILIDSREQRPYRLPNAEVRGLPTGDYSIAPAAGMEQLPVLIERKSKEDLFSSLGRNRDRFEREVRRMAEYDYAAIVIEASLEDLLEPPPFSCMSPRVVIRTLLSWSVRYGLHVLFVGSRRCGQALTHRLLLKYWQHHGGCAGGG